MTQVAAAIGQEQEQEPARVGSAAYNLSSYRLTDPTNHRLVQLAQDGPLEGTIDLSLRLG